MSQERANQLLEAGLWLRLSGDLPGAKRLFEQALEIDPSNERARQLLRREEGHGAEGGLLEKDWSAVLDRQVSPAADPFAPPRAAPQGTLDPAQSPFEAGSTTATRAASEPWFVAPGARAENLAEIPVASDPVRDLPEVEVVDEGVSMPQATAWAADPGGLLPAPAVVLDRPGVGDAMDLVAKGDVVPPPVPVQAPPAEDEVARLIEAAKKCLHEGDVAGAEERVDRVAKWVPSHPGIARARAAIEQRYLAGLEVKLGSLQAKPKVALKRDEIIWLDLDHRAGFLLAQIDGTISFEDLFSISGMSRIDTARILVQLVDKRVIRT